MSIKQELHINKFKLDEELVNIAMQLQDYGEQHSEAVKRKDKQKLKLEVLEAELQTELRKNWQELGFDKAPTVAQADSFIKTNEKYQKESDKLVDISSEVSYNAATLTALQAKRSALGNLVQLFLTNYWSDQSLSAESVNVLNERMNNSGRRRKSINSEEEE